MVQIIDENRPKSTMEKFGAAFANAGQAAGRVIPEYMKNRENLRALAQEDKDIMAATGINLSGIRDPEARKAIMAAQLKGKQRESEHGFAKELQKGKYEAEEGLAGTKKSFDMANLQNLENLKHEHAKEIQGLKPNPNAQKEAEAKQVKDIGQQSFNGIAQLLNKGNVGKGSGVLGYFGGETAEDTGEFQSLTGGLEAMMVDMVSRGTLSNTRFQYITETLLPKPTDTQSEIKGKLKGLAQILGLDASALKDKGKGKSKSAIEMTDAEGNVYDIPPDMYEKAKAQGFIG